MLIIPAKLIMLAFIILILIAFAVSIDDYNIKSKRRQ